MQLKKILIEKYQIFIAISLAFIFVIIGSVLAYYNGLRDLALITTVITFTTLITGYTLLSVEIVRQRIGKFFVNNTYTLWLVIILFCLVYFIYALGNQAFSLKATGKLVLFLSFPTVVIFLANGKRNNKWVFLYYLVAILLIWLPFDFRLLSGIWTGKVVYAFNVLVAFNLAIILFAIYSQIKDVGYDLIINKSIIYHALVNFAIFAIIAIPLGLGIKFLEFAPRNQGFIPVFLTALGIFLFTALPEELLFRGLMQNILGKWLSNDNYALVIASVVFGLAHLNNASYPQNIKYCLLATIAGIFYGRVYLATRSILAGAITHALIDVVWHELFK